YFRRVIGRTGDPGTLADVKQGLLAPVGALGGADQTHRKLADLGESLDYFLAVGGRSLGVLGDQDENGGIAAAVRVILRRADGREGEGREDQEGDRREDGSGRA